MIHFLEMNWYVCTTSIVSATIYVIIRLQLDVPGHFPFQANFSYQLNLANALDPNQIFKEIKEMMIGGFLYGWSF